MKKLLFIITYFLIKKFFPMLGTTSFYFEDEYAWFQQLTFLLFGLLLFRKELAKLFVSIKWQSLALTSLLAVASLFLFEAIYFYLLSGSVGVGRYDLTLLTTVNVVLMTPIVEELVYRYSMTRWPIKNWLNLSIMLLSAWIFAYGHAFAAGYSLLGLVPFFVMALLFQFIYIKKKNIWYAIAAHVLNNGVVLLLSLIFT